VPVPPELAGCHAASSTCPFHTSHPEARGARADLLWPGGAWRPAGLLRARGHGGCRLQAPLLGRMGNQDKGRRLYAAPEVPPTPD